MYGSSAFYGIEPIIETFADPDRKAVAAGGWLADCIAEESAVMPAVAAADEL